MNDEFHECEVVKDSEFSCYVYPYNLCYELMWKMFGLSMIIRDGFYGILEREAFCAHQLVANYLCHHRKERLEWFKLMSENKVPRYFDILTKAEEE
jgi:hypothetical protein